MSAEAKADVSLTYLLLCDSHTMNGGKHNYYGVFQRIMAKKFPSYQARLHLAMEFLGPPGEVRRFILKYVDSQDEEVVPALQFDVTFSEFGAGTCHFDLNGLPLPRPGIFSFRIFAGDTKVGERMLFLDEAKG